MTYFIPSQAATKVHTLNSWYWRS